MLARSALAERARRSGCSSRCTDGARRRSRLLYPSSARRRCCQQEDRRYSATSPEPDDHAAGLLSLPNTPTRPSSFTVRTHRSILLPVGTALSQRVALPVADVHLRHESLPFAFFFAEPSRLCEEALTASLQRVLQQHFAVAGGRIADCYTAIQCEPDDTVPLSFAQVDCTLQEWQEQASPARQHEHLQGQHPVLLPLFDSLFGEVHQLLSVKVTYFTCGATCLGVTTNHCLADTASCIQLVESWGQEMMSEENTATMAEPAAIAVSPAVVNVCWNRAKASSTGMMTTDMAELMGLRIVAAPPDSLSHINNSTLFPAWMTMGFWNDTADHDSRHIAKDDVPEGTPKFLSPALPPSPTTPVIVTNKHEYLALHFSLPVLKAMKAHGMVALNSSGDDEDENDAGSNNAAHQPQHLLFVSTNDMVTAASWVMKRQLSRQKSWNLSVVVNLRGRCGVGAFGTTTTTDGSKEEGVGGEGLFGNAISNVVAKLDASAVFGKTSVRQAAYSIRRALIDGIANEIPNRMITSRLGQEAVGPPSSINSFSTTSWRQLEPWKIRFSNQHMVSAFGGQPACPLPVDGSAVYSSVLHSRADGDGCTVELFLPSSQVEEAERLHAQLCRSYTDWQQQQQQQQQMDREAGLPRDSAKNNKVV